MTKNYSLLNFTDNKVPEDVDVICFMLRKLDEEYKKQGLTINANITEYIVIRNTSRDKLLEQGVARESIQTNILVSQLQKTHKCSINLKKNHIGQRTSVTRQLHSTLPVSYTHLDVYKRQSLPNPKIKPFPAQ